MTMYRPLRRRYKEEGRVDIEARGPKGRSVPDSTACNIPIRTASAPAACMATTGHYPVV